jgi:hypothetical protein
MMAVTIMANGQNTIEKEKIMAAKKHVQLKQNTTKKTETKPQQQNIKDMSSERLALLLHQNDVQLMQIQQNIQMITTELQRREQKDTANG